MNFSTIILFNATLVLLAAGFLTKEVGVSNDHFNHQTVLVDHISEVEPAEISEELMCNIGGPFISYEYPIGPPDCVWDAVMKLTYLGLNSNQTYWSVSSVHGGGRINFVRGTGPTSRVAYVRVRGCFILRATVRSTCPNGNTVTRSSTYNLACC